MRLIRRHQYLLREQEEEQLRQRELEERLKEEQEKRDKEREEHGGKDRTDARGGRDAKEDDAVRIDGLQDRPQGELLGDYDEMSGSWPG